MLRGTLKNLLTADVIGVHATTDSVDSSYGFECWVDPDGNSYGQVQFGAPFGFELLRTWEDDEDGGSVCDPGIVDGLVAEYRCKW